MGELTTHSSLGELHIDRTPRRARRLPRARVLVALLLLFAVALGALVLALRPAQVKVVEVRESRPGEDVTRLDAAGYVASRRRFIIAPKIPGRLKRVLVEEGQSVEEGQELAKLEDDDAKVAVAEARAARDTAIANAARAKAELAQAKRELGRTERLAAKGALSASVLDQAKSTVDASAAASRATDAQVETARAGLEAAELRLSQTVVTAPFAGTVVRKLADEGAMLAPATIATVDVGGIVELVDLSALEVEAEVSEERLSQVHEGEPALITLDAYPGKVFQGVTGSVRPAVDRSKATAVVKVRFDRVPEGALPDMGAKVAFLTRPLQPEELRGPPPMRVPAVAVVRRDGDDVVFTVDQGRARAVPVTVERRAGEDAVLRAGPAAGTRVVAAPKSSLRDGARVRVEGAS